MSQWLDIPGAIWVDVSELEGNPSEGPVRWRITDASRESDLTFRILQENSTNDSQDDE